MNDEHDNRKDDDAMLARLTAEAERIQAIAGDQPGGCYFIPAAPHDKNGWVPSWVSRDQPGHTPFAGNGICAQPWYWGTSYEQAKGIADAENAKLGISPAMAAEIILSSVRASRHAGREHEYTGPAGGSR